MGAFLEVLNERRGPVGEDGRTRDVSLVEDVNRQEVGEGRSCTEFEEGVHGLRVVNAGREAVEGCFECTCVAEEELLDVVRGTEWLSQELKALSDFRGGAIE